MKSHGNLFAEICALENMHWAARKARRRKTRKIYVEDFDLHRERFVAQLRAEMLAGVYRPRGYRNFYIHDPKKRLISAAPYRDRVVHHALCNVLEPLLQRRFVLDSYSCQRDKGTTAAHERCRYYTNRYGYVLKCDIQKFFQSVDQRILMDKLERIIRCRPTLALCGLILDSYHDEEVPPIHFPGDGLFTPHARRRGLPIGNLTSQIWANFYLDRMDHHIKEKLRAPAYARYTDDWLLWSDDKGFLHACQGALTELLQTERLRLHPVKTRIMACREGVPFLGFRFFPGHAPRLLGTTKRRFERRTRRQWAAYCAGLFPFEKLRVSAFGWTQFSRYGNVKGLLAAYLKSGFGRAGL